MSVLDSLTEQAEDKQENLDGVSEDSQGQESEAAPTEEQEVPGQEEPPAPAAEKNESVPLALHLEERRKRQDLEARLAAIEMEKAAAATRAAETPPAYTPGQPLDPNDPDPYAAVSDDDLPTIGQQKAHEAWVQRENYRMAAIQQQQTVNELEKEARIRFTKEACGEFFDFDTVMKTAMNFLTKSDWATARHSSDPVGKIYELAIERAPLLKNLRDSIKKPANASAPTGQETPPPPSAPKPAITASTTIKSIVDHADQSPAAIAARLAEGG